MILVVSWDNGAFIVMNGIMNHNDLEAMIKQHGYPHNIDLKLDVGEEIIKRYRTNCVTP